MIPATALLVSLSVLTSSRGGNASSMNSREKQETYLKKYGYMGPGSYDPRFAHITDANEIFRLAVMQFQWMTRMNETGVVDEATVKMMEKPRCGNPDVIGMSMLAKRRRRRRHTAPGVRWSKTILTYRINNYTPDLPQDVTDSEIQTAFKVTDSTQVDIDIYFDRQDGPYETLAYAAYPENGDIHFDEDEEWTSKIPTGHNLLWVATHEIGHSLGLGHSNIQGSIMVEGYTHYNPDLQLHTDDIDGIKYIYGSMMEQAITKSSSTNSPSSVTPLSNTTTTIGMPPASYAICHDPNVDAIFAVNEDVYFFKGAQYYMGHRHRFLSPARPIKDDWPGLPDNIDTAVYLDGSIVFFKGHQCWRYSSTRQPESSNPQDIATVFPGLPNNINAAFVWSGNGKFYAISDDKYYRMSERFNNSYRVDIGYPHPLRIWKGLPPKINAAFNYTNGRTYFFYGSNYYRFNDVTFKVDTGYPKSTADNWLGCSDSVVSDVKAPEDDMMEKEWLAGGDQFDGNQPVIGGVGLPTCSGLVAVIAMLALCLLFP